jgi:hypothetical protein
MTFIPTNSGEYHLIAQIYLTGLTLYYADSNLSMSDGHYYDGRMSASALSRAFSSFTEPTQRQSTITITLRDEDLTIRQLLDTYVWGNRRVKLYIGKGRNLSDYKLEFNGLIKYPDGIDFDLEKVNIQLRDSRNSDWVILPANKFWKTDYPHLEDAAEGQPIPIAYGAFSYLPMPVRCIDTTLNEFKIADHAIVDILQVYLNGDPVNNTNENLTLATFRISAYDPASDVVTVSFLGKLTGYTSFTDPISVLYDLLDYENVLSENIDFETLDELAIEFKDFRCRRYINEEISSNTLIEDLAIECGFDVFIIDGRYTARSRCPQLITDLDIDEMSILTDSFKVETDPESLYANKINCYYSYSPQIRDYLLMGQENNIYEQGRLGQIIPRTINFKWLYQKSDVYIVAQRLLMLYSREINVIQITALGDAILLDLADHVGITFGHYFRRPMMIREVTKNFDVMSCTIYGYDMIKHMLPGYWTDDDAPSYEDATPEQRAIMGYWTNDIGEAKPGDPDSVKSCWW